MKRKLLSVLLVTVMLLTCVPLGALSVSAETEGDYTYTVTDGEATITGYNGAGGTVITPATLGGYPVISIGDWAFSRCTSLTSVTIPDSVVSIGRNAFNMCTGLSTVTISDSVATLGMEAFYECTALTSLVLSNSLTVIDQGVFWNCTSLTSVTVPKNVTTIGSCAFYGSGLSSITLPVSVSTIAWGAFSGCTNLSDVYYAGVGRDRDKITISSNNDALLSATWHYAEDPAKGLLYEIVDGEVTITGYTEDMPANLIIPATIESYPVIEIRESAFYGCTKLNEVVIPEGVTTIGAYAFYDVSAPIVVIPSSVTYIGGGAFHQVNCRAADYFGVFYTGTEEKWNNITVIDEGNNNNRLNGRCNVVIEDGIIYRCYSGGTASILASTCEVPLDVVLPSEINGCSVTHILSYHSFYGDLERGAFAGRELTSVILPEGVKYIGGNAFGGCDFTSIVIPDSVTVIGGFSCVDAIADVSYSVFAGCDKLETIVLGKGVTKLQHRLFEGCSALASIFIPDNVTDIEEGAFNKCPGLVKIEVAENNPNYCSAGGVLFNKDMTTLIQYPAGRNEVSYTIPDGVVSISYSAFSESQLCSIVVPDSVKVIDSAMPFAIEYIGAFTNCENLETLVLGKGVKTIQMDAFSGCTALKNIYYTGTEADRTAITIGSGNTYLTDATWHYNCNNPKDHYSADIQHSVMDTDNGNGLAFHFELSAQGVTIASGVADLTNATINYLGQACKLVGAGAVITNQEDATLELGNINGQTMIDIPMVYLQAADEDSCAFATRIIDIPESALERTVYARPYYIAEVNGEQIVVYGDIDSASCAEYM